MSRKKKKRGKSDVWKYKLGSFTAYERKDRGRQIWTRVGPNTFGGYDDVRPLCGTIRNPDGSINPELETLARAAADERYKQRAATSAPVDPKAPLTLRAAIGLVMDPKSGKYVRKDGWSADAKRYLQLICTIPFSEPGQPSVQHLGDLLLEQLRHAHYRRVWRWMAEEHVKDSKRFGVRTAEMACGALRAAMVWLAQEEIIDPGTGLPAPRWKTQMQGEWQAMTGKPLAPPKRPRYTKEESEKLWAALPKADPRIRVATEIGAELRLGQVVERTRRSDIQPHRGHEIGTVRVHGSGKKRGAEVVLTDQPRAVLMEAMASGYLSELEKAYKAGTLPDYLLITGGYFLKGKAQVKHAMTALSPRVMRKHWRDLEELAGVEYVPGRGWYGMRRRAADDAEDVSSDARVLNKMGGWTDSKTRSRYQEESRMDVAEKAADVRGRIRPKRAPESAEFIPPNSTTHEA